MKRLIYPALLLLLAACGKVDVERKAKTMNLELKAPTPAQKNVAAISDLAYDEQKPEQPKESTHEVSKKIIKEGDISFETNNIRQTRNILCSSLSKLGGYVGEEKESNNSDNNRKEYNLNVRIPSRNFDQFLNGVVSIAEKIDSKNIRRTDVTTEYIDITTQLANKKILEGRYLELLKKSSRMSDMLQIENKLTEIRTDIESTQGKLNYLVKQVDYSSLDITFYNKQIVPDNGYSFGYKLTSALSDGWIVLGGLFFGFLQVWPVWILLGIAVYFVKRWLRKNSKQKATQAANGEVELNA